MERERQLEAKKPRRASLVDPALIEEYYGPPSLKRKDSLSSGSQATPTKTTPTKVADDTPIKDAEDAPRETTPINDPWADSESEEEDLKVLKHMCILHASHVTNCVFSLSPPSVPQAR